MYNPWIEGGRKRGNEGRKMMNIIIERVQETVAFKKNLEVGDLILTQSGRYPVYAIVSDIRANLEKEEVGQWWDIDLILLFMPPKKHSITINTEQLAGRERWIVDNMSHIFVPLDLTSIGQQKPFLKLIKTD
jgi:hypothetical protein